MLMDMISLQYGGAIASNKGSVILVDSIFSGNEADVSLGDLTYLLVLCHVVQFISSFVALLLFPSTDFW